MVLPRLPATCPPVCWPQGARQGWDAWPVRFFDEPPAAPPERANYRTPEWLARGDDRPLPPREEDVVI
jgi:hypothetical protein